MAAVTHSGELCAALEAYYAGGSTLDGAGRVRQRFPANAESLIAEVQELHRTEKQSWGGWLATFQDPSDNELQIVQYYARYGQPVAVRTREDVVGGVREKRVTPQ